jgi:plastocyanin
MGDEVETEMKSLLLGTIVPLLLVGGAVAAEVEVKMLDKGVEGMMVFEPSLVTIQPVTA